MSLSSTSVSAGFQRGLGLDVPRFPATDSSSRPRMLVLSMDRIATLLQLNASASGTSKVPDCLERTAWLRMAMALSPASLAS
jgi:hypothetical protein